MSLNYIYFAEDTGYGVAGRGMIQALRHAGIHVEETPIQAGDPRNGGHLLRVSVSQASQGVIVHTVPEYYPYWLKVRKGEDAKRPVWGYTTWETDRIPSHWPELLNAMDGVFVTSHWNKNVFEACGVRCPIRVLPHVSQFHGQASGDLSPLMEDAAGQAEGCFVFYHIGVWSERKATEALLHAYFKEFGQGEKVLLILKTGEMDWSSYKPRWRRWGRAAFRPAGERFQKIRSLYPASAPAIHLHEEMKDEEIAQLHRIGDCFVSMTRGEGWGMGAYEAAWFGKGVAMTAFGGQLDFLPQELSWHLPYRLVPVHTAYGSRSYQAGQSWAEAAEEEARRILRTILEGPDTVRERGRCLQAYVRESFSDSVIVQHCMEVFG